MENKIDSKKPWWQPGLVLFARLSSWIAGPVIMAVFFGKYLDEKFQSRPWLFLASVGIAFIISIVMIVRIGLKEMNKIEKKDQNIEKQETEGN